MTGEGRSPSRKKPTIEAGGNVYQSAGMSPIVVDAANVKGRVPWPDELLNARVVFWCCPDHVGAPHRVEWRDGIAHCLTKGCGRTSAPARGVS